MLTDSEPDLELTSTQASTSNTSAKLKNSNTSVFPLSKRVPDRVMVEGGLCDEEYFQTIKKIRRFHLNGEWSEGDRLVLQYPDGKNTEVH